MPTAEHNSTLPSPHKKLQTLAPLLPVLALALALRIAVCAELISHPLFSSLRLDEIFNDQWAIKAARGELFPSRVPISAPGYPWFLALFYAIFGRNLLLPRLAQMALGLGAVLLVYQISRALFGRSTALLSAMLFGLYWPLVIFEQRLLLASLFLFLNLAALWCGTRAVVFNSFRGWCAAGLLLGAALIVYPTAAVWIALLGFRLAAPLFRRPRTESFRRAGGFAAAVLAAAGPVVVFSSLSAGEWHFLRGYGGFNFYLGNNAAADGTMYARLGGAWDRMESLPYREAKITAAAAQDRFYLRKTMEFLRDDPSAFLRLQLRKLGLLFNRREIRATIDPEFHRRLFPVLGLPWPGFAAIFGLALAGTLRLSLSRKSHRFLLLYLASHALPLLFTVISSRYRLPFTVGLCLLAGAGGVELARSLIPRPAGRQTASRLRRRSAPVLFLAGLALAYLPLGPRYSEAEEYTYLGLAFSQAGDIKRARQYYQQALASDPNHAMAMIELAWIEFQQRDLPAALKWQFQAVAADPRGAYAHFDLGQYLWAAGKKEEALREFRAAVENKPLWEDAVLKLAETEIQMGLEPAARQRLLEFRRLRPDLAPKIDRLLDRIK